MINKLILRTINSIASPFLGKGIIDKYFPYLNKLFIYFYTQLQSDKETLINLHKNKFMINPKDGGVGLYLLLKKSYEKTQSELLLTNLHHGNVFIDIGANIGIYTIPAAKKVGTDGKVYAFEPDIENVRLLKKNIGLNKLQNIQVINKAVTSSVSKMRFYSSKRNKAQSALLHETEWSSHDAISTVSLDKFFNPFTKIDLIKIDVEGAEIMVLKGAEKTIQKQKGLKLFIEYNPERLRYYGHRPKDLIQVLLKLGFNIELIIDETNHLLLPYSKERLHNVLKHTTFCNLYAHLK